MESKEEPIVFFEIRPPPVEGAPWRQLDAELAKLGDFLPFIIEGGDHVIFMCKNVKREAADAAVAARVLSVGKKKYIIAYHKPSRDVRAAVEPRARK